VVAPEPLPLAKILGPELGAFIRDLHAERGVDFRLGLTVESVGPSDVVLADGARVAADLVVSGVGVRPVVALAERAGLALDRGIVVDARLETSVPGVFAAGDLARYPFHVTGESIRVEHWVHAERQGQAAARNMLGAGETFRDVPFFWSHHYEDVAINYVGHAEKWERIDVDGSFAERNVAVSYWNRGVRVALATIFRDRESLEAELALERL
jgi:NADPH-dependent 2,4-dienoyl-CoA reductase/sulfur reductase-like enzyme